MDRRFKKGDTENTSKLWFLFSNKIVQPVPPQIRFDFVNILKCISTKFDDYTKKDN